MLLKPHEQQPLKSKWGELRGFTGMGKTKFGFHEHTGGATMYG